MVPRKLLWPAIRIMGILQESTVVLQEMYENNEGQVKVVNTVSTSCRTTKGLKQGHILSPTLFQIYLESVL
jgi:retron-type reverse transcriptase